MCDEIHLTKKDFKISWYSGQGAGGQHRNKSSNCCRITHMDSGLTVSGTESRSRVSNQGTAFTKLAKMLVSYYSAGDKPRGVDTPPIRSYHGVRNEVRDHLSGLRESYSKVVVSGDIGNMVESRRLAMLKEDLYV